MAAGSVACCLNEAMTLYWTPLASVLGVKGSTLMSATMCDTLRDPEPSEMSSVTNPAHEFPCAFWEITASKAGTLSSKGSYSPRKTEAVFCTWFKILLKSSRPSVSVSALDHV